MGCKSSHSIRKSEQRYLSFSSSEIERIFNEERCLMKQLYDLRQPLCQQFSVLSECNEPDEILLNLCEDIFYISEILSNSTLVSLDLTKKLKSFLRFILYFLKSASRIQNDIQKLVSNRSKNNADDNQKFLLLYSFGDQKAFSALKCIDQQTLIACLAECDSNYDSGYILQSIDFDIKEKFDELSTNQSSSIIG